MITENPEPHPDDVTLKCYEIYKKGLDNRGDPAALGYSFSILDDFIALGDYNWGMCVGCTALHFRVSGIEHSAAFQATDT